MDKENRSGGSSERKWDYMEIMLDIYDQKANIFPQNISNSGALPTEDGVNNDDEAVVTVRQQPPQPITKKENCKRKPAESLADLFHEANVQRRTDSERRHRENLASFDRMLDILERKL